MAFELKAAFAGLLRDICGNPFRPITNWGFTPFPEDGRRIKALARAAYQERPGRKCERCKGSGRAVLGIEHWNPLTRNLFSPDFKPCPNCHGTSRIEDGLLDADRFAVLADALIDAGCPEDEECPNSLANADMQSIVRHKMRTAWDCKLCHNSRRVPNPLLAHLRGPGPHVRGCHVLDLLLGKE